MLIQCSFLNPCSDVGVTKAVDKRQSPFCGCSLYRGCPLFLRESVIRGFTVNAQIGQQIHLLLMQQRPGNGTQANNG